MTARSNFTLALCAIAVACVATASPALSQGTDADDADRASVTAVVELRQPLFYAGEPLLVRLIVGNETDRTLENPIAGGLFDGFRVATEDGTVLEAAAEPSAGEPARPEKLASGAFYGAIIDLSQMYPQLKEVGTFEISWTKNGIESARYTVNLIPEYEPSVDYRARIRTEEGPIVIDFFGDRSPIGVKAFIDMANAGFYDGLLIHEVRADRWITLGDAAASGSQKRPIVFPAEPSDIPVVSGTVLLKPVGAAPPANSSPFMIVLKPTPALTGQATVIGQVVQGLDVAQRLSRRPSTLESRKPFYRPLKDLKILGIEVSRKADASTAAPANASEGE